MHISGADVGYRALGCLLGVSAVHFLRLRPLTGHWSLLTAHGHACPTRFNVRRACLLLQWLILQLRSWQLLLAIKIIATVLGQICLRHKLLVQRLTSLLLRLVALGFLVLRECSQLVGLLRSWRGQVYR